MNVVTPARSIRYISLCAGGGGLDLGIELAMPCSSPAVMVERESFAVANLVAAMQQGFLADVPVWSNARSFNGRPWRGIVDGVVGGIPCQSHSLAGKKLGSLDERDLWSTARRIIVQSRPWFVLIENVAGMLSAGADEIAGAERVRRDLHRLGFKVEAGLFTASEVGASHERERLFILGVADYALRGWSAGDVARGCDGAQRPHRGCSGDVEDPDRRQQSGRSAGREEANGWRSHHQHSGPSEGFRSQHVGLADADDAGLERYRESIERPGECVAGQSSGELVDASGNGWREWWAEPAVRSGRDTAASTSDAMGDAISGGYDGRSDDSQRVPQQRTIAQGTGGGVDRIEVALADPDSCAAWRHGRAIFGAEDAPATERNEHRYQPDRSWDGSGEVANLEGKLSLFPPGPGDIEAWRYISEFAPERLPAISSHDRFMLTIRAALIAADGDPTARERLDPKGPYGLRAEVVQAIAESHLRKLDDGLAAARIDWLRLLGNGCVPLQVATAFRTLCHRLAHRGSSAAAQLVRMMEQA